MRIFDLFVRYVARRRSLFVGEMYDEFFFGYDEGKNDGYVNGWNEAMDYVHQATA